ncbi:unnamed protein product [Miscanthus lutarioriparius]|uniref:BED-type domain-containing protein n=1 Tax=Miscanthus lutarioriparius TaxID=422564 RepID=A0A811RN71_9POAL|nr:unnamed protein product [Miscanthus lutarioriparius]
MLRPDLLEAGEANALVGVILWLAKTILETRLPTGELDAWLQRVGLAGAIGALKYEVERMKTVVNGVGGRAVGNKPLARSLARVKEFMYDADDVVDELDYYRLQHQVERAMIAPAIDRDGMIGDRAEQVDASANTFGMLAPATEPEGMVGLGDGDRDREEHADASANNTGTLNNSGRKNQSEVRDYFQIIPSVNGEPAKAKCNCCARELTWGHGTSALHKHLKSCNKKRSAIEETPNRPSVGDSVQNGATISTYDSEGRKRMRIEYNVAATTHFLKRIQEIVLELRSIRHDVIEYLKDSIARPDQYQINNSDTRVRTSSSLPGKVYGRGEEKAKIIRAIEAATSDNITVLPIVGILGVGKTALAKLVYKDPRVERKFEQIWVWVSNIFDEFLLVLDDVCDCMVNSLWKDLLDALGSSCTKGNVIIVTTRNLSIAKRLGTIKPVELRALGNNAFLQLFRACAFGDNNYKEHLDTSLQICAKLKGNPLAAKSAVEMLRERPTLDHWKNIIKNGIWESLQLRGGIVTALKISYYQLPYSLQQCLLFCSIFPNGYLFHIDNLVHMWISSGFVKSVEAGQDYLNALVNSCFLEQVIITDFIILGHKKSYVMCGVMHEFARLVSRAEFATMDGLECKEVLPTVRHFSILIDSVYHEDECGIILHNGKFEEKLKNIISLVRGLRTLILIGDYDSLFFQSFQTFICSLENCAHLRFLKLENKWSNEALPISLSNFYHLEVLHVGQPLNVDGICDLVSMRNLILTKGAFGACSPAWSACLQKIHLEDCKGWEILPSLESLSSLTKLKLRNMPEVTELSIPSLEELVLIDMPKLDRCSSSSVRDLNCSLRVLEIRRCWVLKAFILFESCENFEIEQHSWLLHGNPYGASTRPNKLQRIPSNLIPSLKKLSITGCKLKFLGNKECFSGFTSLEKLSILDCPVLISSLVREDEIDDQANGRWLLPCSLGILDIHFLSLETLQPCFPGDLTRLKVLELSGNDALKSLQLHSCTALEELTIRHCESLDALEGFQSLRSLRYLKVFECPGLPRCLKSLSTQGYDLFPRLERLRIGDPSFLTTPFCKHLTSLQCLKLVDEYEDNYGATGLTCEQEAALQLLTSLQELQFFGCWELSDLPVGLHSLLSLKRLEIIDCRSILRFSDSAQGFVSLVNLVLVAQVLMLLNA